MSRRTKGDYSPVDIERAVALYQGGASIKETARSVGSDNPNRNGRMLRDAGVSIRKSGPIAGSRRVDAYNREFKRQRLVVLEAASHMCAVRVGGVCAGTADHVHHRKTRAHGGDNSLENLLAVCFACHRYLHDNPAEAYTRGWLMRGVA